MAPATAATPGDPRAASVPGGPRAAPVSSGPLVPAFYAGRSVFITGATGFMGKVVVERLLATCPDVERVFLLMRRKRGSEPQQRLQLLKGSEVFAGLRARCPQQLDKLRVVAGDSVLPRLGLGDLELRDLREVSVVFHSAATVKFNAPLQVAVNDNVRSAVAMLAVADSLPALDVLVHVSTAYCDAELEHIEERVYEQRMRVDQVLVHVSTAYCDAELEHIEERVYEQRMRVDQVLAAADLPEDILATITDRFIAPKANTYTFTKAIAESVVAAHAPRRYAVAIFRPSIVVSSHRYPVAGWTDSTAGPAGAALGCGRGVLRAFRMRAGARADLLPVDVAADAMLCAAWDVHDTTPVEVKVYNCSSVEHQPTWGQYRDAVFKYTREHPFNNALWYPFSFTTQHGFLFNILEIVFQAAPLYLLEVLNWLRGVKTHPSPIALSAKLRTLVDVQAFVSMREWRFDVDNVRALRTRVSHADREIFNLDINDVCWDDLFRDYIKGVRKYLLKEKDEDIPEAKRHMARLRILHYVVVSILAALLFYFLMSLLAYLWL